MRDEIRVPLRDAVNNSTTPVVSTDDDMVNVLLLADPSYGICMVLETEVLELRRCSLVKLVVRALTRYCLSTTCRISVTHALQCDASQPKFGQHGDLVAPCKSLIREAMDEEDGASLFSFRSGIKVV